MKKHPEGWDICEHCGKGEKHWTDWDLAHDGGKCKKPNVYGGCVGDWSCRYDPEAAARQALLDSYPKPGDQVLFEGEKGYLVALDPHLEGWGWVRTKYSDVANRVPMKMVEKVKGA